MSSDLFHETCKNLSRAKLQELIEAVLAHTADLFGKTDG